MKQKTMARCLRAVLIGAGLLGLAVYFIVLPQLGRETATANPEYAYCFWPWLAFLWGSGVPCFAVLVIGWLITVDIGRDRSFTAVNARRLKRVAILAAVDSAYFFIGNLVLLFLGMSHPGVALGSLALVFVGLAVTAAAAALSHLVLKAADLQEQSDLTI